jgi:two-component system, chemotaxis family, chemotaxis protein CheY
MIVDDDQTMNSLLQILLELDGYQVILVSNGHMAISTASAQQPDAILMDVHIGDSDGLELLRQIRQHPDLKATPVIMSSGMDKEDECRTAGASAFILKPYPPEQLSATLKELLA